MSDTESEPSDRTRQEIGSLCFAWAFLELHSEGTLRGITSITPEQARIFSLKMAVQEKWNLICRQGQLVFSPEDQSTVNNIRAAISKAADDRNIIIHGVVHAGIMTDSPDMPYGEAMPASKFRDIPFYRQPCWTIFKGTNAEKNFPISSQAVEIVRSNIQLISAKVLAFNKRKNFTVMPAMSEAIEPDWPKPFPELL